NGTPKRVTSDDVGEYYPAWSPDGSSLAYVTWSGKEGAVMRVSAAGGAPTRLVTENGFYQSPAWSPDGTKLVAIRSSDRHLQARIAPLCGDGRGRGSTPFPAPGGSVTAIRPANGLGTPHFGEDPTRIFAYGFVQPPPASPPPTPGNQPVALVSFRW